MHSPKQLIFYLALTHITFPFNIITLLHYSLFSLDFKTLVVRYKIGQSEGRLRGVEFYRMGQTNVVGRYPLHFHYSTTGHVSYIEDCSVHRSYYRSYTIHNTFNLNVTRNVAYDIIGHAFYLESGVEEFNRVEYNLAAFVSFYLSFCLFIF